MLKKLHLFELKKNSILFPIAMLLSMWTVFFLQTQGYFDNCHGAIIPLVPAGLLGIIFSPLLHGNLEHIFSNSIPIAVLSFLLFQFYDKIALKIFTLSWLISGIFTWLLPPIDIMTGEYRLVCIIGASGLVYALAFFLFFSGVFRKEKTLLTISLLVAFYYGGLVWGIFPEELFSHLSEPSKISWQAHLAGAITGLLLALRFKKVLIVKKKKYIWEFPHYYNEKDDRLWQEYKEKHPEDFEEMPEKKEENLWEFLDELRNKKT